MTLSEFFVATLGFAGILTGLSIGFHTPAGVAGAFVGGVLGGGVAVALAMTALAPFFVAVVALEQRLKRRRWARHFGRFWERSQDEGWKRARRHLLPGTLVQGRVVAIEPGRALVDVGCGFPAELTSLNTAGGLLSTAFVGTTIEARVARLDERGHAIALTGRPSLWLVYGGEPVGQAFGPLWPLRDDHRVRYLPFVNETHESFAKRARGGRIVGCRLTDGERTVPLEVVLRARGVLEVIAPLEEV